ncbi:hypothetical protein PRIPAC_75903 [Pristionchus pacificus]|uniref:PDZ domain-containing protein n=1 Tax=Pristionchus pacificus TaxID=54126 RepID=A0A2A6CSA2_PRIPA|nr:hypothetical protein PRIPAC_75903 [Pristionchus pacificus]|eukprot:PDM80947.1 PDZ domain-containing protein [Pristionchus pacificus]
MASPSVIRPSSLISSLPPSTSSDCSLRGYRQLGHFHKKDDMKLHIKSKLGGEFRRFTMTFPGEEKPCFNIFITRLFSLHSLDTPELQEGITIEYTDASDGSHLPIHSDDTLKAAVDSRPSVLRIFLQRRGESMEEQHGYGLTTQMLRDARKRPSISTPSDFRRVSAIVDADTLPFTLRRVQLCKYNSNLKLGFFIKQDTSYRNGFPQSGTFVSKLLDHGIAASTNLLHPNDEIIEVNGIDITERSLDQVTDIMIANSYNIILTVLPAGPPYGGIPSPHVSTTHRHEKGLKSYMDMPAGYGTLSSRGSSGENSSPPAYYSPLGRGRDSLNYSSPHLPPYPTMMFPPPPPMINHHHLPHPVYLPPMRGMPLHPYAFDHTSFSRNTTVRLSDKIKNEKEASSNSISTSFLSLHTKFVIMID